jgi:hypothetical protein
MTAIVSVITNGGMPPVAPMLGKKFSLIFAVRLNNPASTTTTTKIRKANSIFY